jgi:poly-D-alanine transfer protein DltD
MAQAVRVLLLEILTVVIAFSCAFAIFQWLPRAGGLGTPGQLNLPASEFIANPAGDAVRNRVALETNLKNGDWVVFGSSEMTIPSDVAVQKFLPRACGKRVLALGQAGFQSLPILLHLAQARHSLSSKSKIAIIFSPVWFSERGTSSQSLLKFLEPYAISNLLRDPELPTAVPQALARAIHARGDEFTGLYPDWLFAHWPALARLTRDRNPNTALAQVSAEKAPDVTNFDWAAEEEKWRRKTETDAGGNPYGTTLEFFKKVQKHKPPYAFKRLDRWQIEKQDLIALSRFLKHYGVKAHFILQPVHRRIYNGLEGYDRLFVEIEQRLRADGHSWQSSFKEPYDLTVLADAAHFSELEWVRLNREFCAL